MSVFPLVAPRRASAHALRNGILSALFSRSGAANGARKAAAPALIALMTLLACAGVASAQYSVSSPAAVTEGTTVNFVITRATALTVGSEDVGYTTVDAQARSTNVGLGTPDFTSKSGTVTFNVGDLTKTVSVLTSNDAIGEPNETFNLALTGPFAGVTPGSAVIQDDDAPTIGGFTPSQGSQGNPAAYTDATSVTISGNKFIGDDPNDFSLTLNGILIPSASITKTTSSLTFKVPSTIPNGTSGVFRVTTTGGNATSASSFTVPTPSKPTIGISTTTLKALENESVSIPIKVTLPCATQAGVNLRPVSPVTVTVTASSDSTGNSLVSPDFGTPGDPTTSVDFPADGACGSSQFVTLVYTGDDLLQLDTKLSFKATATSDDSNYNGIKSPDQPISFPRLDPHRVDLFEPSVQPKTSESDARTGRVTDFTVGLFSDYITTDDLPASSTNVPNDIRPAAPVFVTVRVKGSPANPENFDEALIYTDSQPIPKTEQILVFSGNVSPSDPTFYTKLQTIHVQGVDDDAVDQDKDYQIEITNIDSRDFEYVHLSRTPPAGPTGEKQRVIFTNIDDDSPGAQDLAGVIITPKSATVGQSPSAPLQTNESGSSATFTVRLSGKPANGKIVTITFTSDRLDEGKVTPATLTFNSTNYSQNQTVTVTGQDDDLVDGLQGYNIVTTLTSDDPNYGGSSGDNGIDPPDVLVNNQDNEVTGITITPTRLTLVEGDVDTFKVVLSKAPSADVFLDLSVGNPSVLSINKTRLRFTTVKDQAVAGSTSGWNVPQTVTVTAKADSVTATTSTKVITATAVSSDASYNIDPSDVDVDILNDERTALSVGDVAVVEGTGGTTNAVFTVTAPVANAQAITVDYATSFGTATAADFTATSGTLTIPANSTSAQISVPINPDSLDEVDENFTLTLSNADANEAVILDNTATGTITDDDGPSVSVSDVTATEGASGTKNFTFNVTLSAASPQTVTVDYATADNTAVAGQDYVATSGSLTFTPGQTTKPVTVSVTGDLVNEPDESFLLNLTNLSATASPLDMSGVGNITNDDAVPAISIADAVATEGNTGTTKNMTFTVSIATASTSDVSVTYTTVDSSAISPDDYAADTQTVTIPAGSLSATFNVIVAGDATDEDDEVFNVNLSNPVNGTLADGQATGTIQDDDAKPTISIGNKTVNETTGGNATALVPVTLSAASGRSVTVNYNTNQGSATAGADYVSTSAQLFFAPGQTTVDIPVDIIGDAIDEDDETFTISLAGPTNADILGSPSATVTIVDNDALPSLSISPAQVDEGDFNSTNMSFNVTLSSASGKAVTVDYSTTPGTATPGAGNDYSAVTGTLTFPAGQTTQTINVPVFGDQIDEANETFNVVLANANNANIGTTSAQGTILDDDAAPTLSVANVQVVEGTGTTNAIATFTLNLSAASQKVVSVTVQSALDTLGVHPAADADIKKLLATVITFNPGETTKTVNVEAIGDALSENDETFLLTLTNANGATLASSSAIGTILDDDAVPVVSIDSITVVEGNTGTKLATFTVTLPAVGRAVAVNFATVPGDTDPATPDVDFVDQTGTVNFAGSPTGATTQKINVVINADRIAEANETYKVLLTSASGAAIDPAKNFGLGTITDDDIANPTITAVAPVKGNQSYATTNGTVVTITGTNFIPGNTSVTFGIGSPSGPTITTSPLTVAADGKTLTVRVPNDAYTGGITVSTTQGPNVQTVSASAALNGLDFIVQPVITDFFDKSDGDKRAVALVDTIHVTGKHFLDLGNGSLGLTVIKAGGAATILDNGSFINIIDDTNLEFLVPRGASTGSLVISTEFGGDGPPSSKPLTVDGVTNGGVAFGPLPIIPINRVIEDEYITGDDTSFVSKRTLFLSAATQKDGTTSPKRVAPVQPIVVTVSVKHSTDPLFMPPTMTIVNPDDPSQNATNVQTADITFPAGQAGLNMVVDVYLTYSGDDVEHDEQTITFSAGVKKNNGDPYYPPDAVAPNVVDFREDLHGITVDTSTVLRTSELGDSDPLGKGVTQFSVGLLNVGTTPAGDPVNDDGSINIDARPKNDVLLNLRAVNQPVVGNPAPGSTPEGLISYYVNDMDNDGAGPDVANGLVPVQPIPQAQQLFLYAVNPTSNEYYRNEHVARVTGVNDNEFDGDQKYVIIADTAFSTDAEYDGLVFKQPVTLVNTDDETNNQQTGQPGFDFSRLSGITTNENGSTDIFTVKLKTKPTGPVDLILNSLDLTEGKLVDPADQSQVQTLTLRFTPDGAASGPKSTRWDISQTVTVKGQDDAIQDGNQAYTIGTTTSSLSDTTYNQIDPPEISAVNQDNELPGATVTPTFLLVNEGDQNTFTVVLNLQPTSNVVINLDSNNKQVGTVDKTILTFTPQNWDVPQTVTVTAVDNDVINSNVAFQVVLANALSSDPNYNGRPIQDVDVTSINDDIPGVTVTPTTGLITTEAGVSATFTVRLDTKPNPGTTITIPLASSDLTEGTVSPAQLVFDPTNYDQPQTVTVTGVDDSIDDGDIAYTVQTKPARTTDGTGATVTADEYNNFNAADVAVTNKNDDVLGVVITPETGLVTSEDGDTATFTARLGTQPIAPVSFTLASSNTAEGTVTPTSLTFTPANYATPQTVTIKGVEDSGAIDGNQAYTIITGATTSTDPAYSGLAVVDPSVTNKDNDAFGVRVTPSTPLTTTEAGGSAIFRLQLTAKPTSDVKIAISSSNVKEGTVSPATITFTPANYNVQQTVTVTGVDDNIDDGDVKYSIITGNTVSTDAGFNDKVVPDVSVTNTDDDDASFIVTPLTLKTVENGPGQAFTVKLAKQPLLGNVQIALAVSDPSEGALSKTMLTFMPSNYDVAQTVIVTPKDDVDRDGPVTYQVKGTIAPSTKTPDYRFLKFPTINVTNDDDETAGVVVTPTTLSLTEGQSKTFTIRLTSRPKAKVTIPLTWDNDEVTVSPSTVTIQPTYYDSPVTVTVRTVDDKIDEATSSFKITTGVTESTDGLYKGKDVQDVNISILDNDTFGFEVKPQSGLKTSESGGSSGFQVRLLSQPTASVTIPLTTTPAGEVAVSPASLVFTTANWQVFQTVKVAGQDDQVVDGNKAFTVVTGASVSSDPFYNGKTVPDVTGINMDNDVAGIAVTPVAGLVTTEAGGTASFNVSLKTQPVARVTLRIKTTDISEGVPDKSSLVFTPADYSVPQTVTVTGVDDKIADGTVVYGIEVGPATGDPGYLNRSGPQVKISNIDNDVRGVTVTPTSGYTTEGGGTHKSTIVLDTQPAQNVTVTATLSDSTEAKLSSTSFVFTSATWNKAQTLTVTGLNDQIPDGNQDYNVSFAVTSADPVYNSAPAAKISLTNYEAGISVVKTSVATTEAGGTFTFSVKLTGKPAKDVTVGVSSSDEGEGTVSDAQLFFTPDNYAAPQTVTVKGVDDDVVDGTQSYLVQFKVTSTDAGYSRFAIPAISATNSDNDSAGIVVSPTTGLVTSEDGGVASFTVVLTSAPTDTVTISLTSSNTAEGTVSPGTLTFTAANFKTPQPVSVTGADDDIVDGPKTYKIITGNSESSDPLYKNLIVDDVAVTNTDDDSGTGNGTGNDGGSGDPQTDFAVIGKTYAFSVPFTDNATATTITTVAKAFTVPPVTGTTTNYTLQRFNPLTQQLVTLDKDSPIRRGEGYLITPVSTGTGIRRPADDATRIPTAATSFDVTLRLNPSLDAHDANNGMNLIGFPFDPAKYSLAKWLSSQVKAKDGTIYPTVTAAANAGVMDSRLFTLDESEGGAGSFINVTNIGMVPFEGYYARTYEDGVVITLKVP